MDLPVMPPVAPMLAKPVAELPDGPWSFEPKWDGFRTIVFRDGDQVELGSRRERPLTRYFPELVAAVKTHLPTCCVIDAEIVVPDPVGRRLDWDALLLRIHPGAAGRLRPAGAPGRGLDRPAVHPSPRRPGGRPGAGGAAGPPDPRHHRPPAGRRVACAL
jgi:hypothetical protein